MKLIKKIKTFITPKLKPAREMYLIGLTVICVVIFLTNFPFGTWLTGWDNLHPELNSGLNISRAFTSVWQENQGLGHLGGHGHAANLLHSLFIAFIGLFLPQESLRSVFTFLMLFLGAFGVFFLSDYVLAKQEKVSKLIYPASFLAALLYMLNFSTIENFYVQLESFIIFYGILPWTLLTLFKYLDTPNRRNLIRFGILSLILSPIGFIPPLFVAYGIVIGFIVLFYWLAQRNRETLKRLGLVLLVIFVTNAYWLLPSLYFTATTTSTYLNSQNNQLSTQDFNLQSMSYGGFMDVVLLRGFMIASIDSPVQQGQKSFYIMQQWLDHSNSFMVKNVGLILFTIVLLGAINGVRKGKSYAAAALAATYLFMFAALAQRVFPFSVFDEFLKLIPVINQAFRAGYTKLSVPLALAFCLLFGQGVVALLNLSEKVYKRSTVVMIVPLVTALVIFFAYPIFQGQLLYKREKVDIPQEYLQLFEYFKQQPKDQRIANLPVQWNWGWDIYTWGYSGSGFLWYGLEQPIIDRSFDVWSSANESFYHEVSTAVYEEPNTANNVNIFQKYQVSWAILDQNQVLPGFDRSVMRYDETKKLLENSGFKLVKEFGNILVYKSDLPASTGLVKSDVMRNISPSVPYNRLDSIATNESSFLGDAVQYPFRDLNQARQLPGISFGKELMTISRKVSISGNLNIPALYTDSEKGSPVPVKISAELHDQKVKLTFTTMLPVIKVGDHVVDENGTNSVEVTLPKNAKAVGLKVNNENFSLSTESIQNVGTSHGLPKDISVLTDQDQESLPLQEEFQLQPLHTCWMRPNETVEVEKQTTADGFNLLAKNGSACVNHRFGQLSADDGKVLHITFEAQSPNGGKPDLCINMEGTDQSCLNKDLYGSSITSKEWQKFDELIPIDKDGTYWINLLGRTSDLTSEKREIDYRNLRVSFLSSSVTATIPAESWQKYNKQESFPVKAGDEIKVEVPLSLAQTWQPQSDSGPVGNCEFQQVGTVQQEINGNAIRLSAENGGVACKSALFSNVSLNQPYILHLQGTHSKGRGFKFYVMNQATKHQDLEYLLPPENFDVSYGLLAWPDTHNSGYSVGLESRSFPEINTENTLNQLMLVPLPNLTEIAVLDPSKSVRDDNKINITWMKKFGNYLYVSEMEANKANAVIELSQGFHKGWLAIQVDHPKLLSHVLVNDWANGWKLSQGRHMVIILYWPQLLEFAGFLIFLAGLGAALIYRFRHKLKAKSWPKIRKSLSTVIVGKKR